MIPATFTHKITSLYVAYAPEFEVAAYGVCRDEALNNLSDELRRRQHEDGSQLAPKGFSNAGR